MMATQILGMVVVLCVQLKKGTVVRGPWDIRSAVVLVTRVSRHVARAPGRVTLSKNVMTVI